MTETFDVEMRRPEQRRRMQGHGVITTIALAFLAGSLSPDVSAAGVPAGGEHDDVTSLAAYNVKADRIEDFGFRASFHLGNMLGSTAAFVSAVLPNTAAAKAGLRPGDRLLKSDGKSGAITLFSLGKWQKIEALKWAQVAARKTNVTWELEVQRAGETGMRTIKMIVPTPAPHWGASRWQAPPDRPSAKVTDAGPLAQLSRDVLDNGVWASAYMRRSYFFGMRWPFDPGDLLGYEWSLRDEGRHHEIFVTQQRGRTEIVLQVEAPEAGASFFLTSPAGALEKAWRWAAKGSDRSVEIPRAEARRGFQEELRFWLDGVGRVTGRWPFEVLKPRAGAGSAATTHDSTSEAPKAFLQLPRANEQQRTLFSDALGKIGSDENRWAYTETSRGLDDRHVTVTRIDPSQPEGKRCRLISIDGKPPSPAAEQRWHDEGRDVPALLSSLPPLTTIVDITDVWVHAEEAAAIVFELPMRSDNPEFPAEKFQALFRVNKARRAFEDILVALRDPVTMGSAAKITEAGFSLRFQTIDSQSAPQPVALSVRGAARVIFVKLSRALEITRSDFERVASEDK